MCGEYELLFGLGMGVSLGESSDGRAQRKGNVVEEMESFGNGNDGEIIWYKKGSWERSAGTGN
jgi:hypothetical protein